MSIRFFSFAFAALVATQGAALPLGAQTTPAAALEKLSYQPNDTLPNDTAVTIGTLPNGLKYYIRANKKPEKRAEFRLVVKAGSLMEDDDQRGLAHWVEHMAFNGTKNFKENDLIHYLQSIGVRFGADLNANTNFDRTIYILPVPTDTAEHVRKALQILEDWAHNITFDKKDFEEERGVVLAELRSRLGAGSRITDKQIPVVYKGSKYPERLPIGTKESLEGATHEQLVRYYKKWYRPDLMAVIAVGDFDKKEMEKMIIDQFSNIPKAEGPTPNPKFPIPPQPGTTVLVIDDPEITSTQAGIVYKRGPYPKFTYAAERAALIRNFFSSLLGQRYGEITQKPGAPFLGAGVSFGELSEDVGTVDVGIGVSNNGIARGLEAALVEIARVAQHGFTNSELDRAKKSYLAQIENYYLARNDRPSSGFANAYINHFMSGDPVPSIELQVALLRELTPTITVEEINKEAGFWKLTDSRLLLITQPKKEGIQQPDTAALLALFDKVAGGKYAAYEDNVDNSALIETMPKAGTIVAEKQHPDVGVTEWKLSNGITVLVKPTDFQANQIIFSGFSPGGSSLWADSLFPTAAFVGSVVSPGGIGRFSITELRKRLSGLSASVSTNIGGNTQGVSGGSSRKDLETMMQLLYLNLTAPRYDSVAIAAQFEQIKAQLANRSSDPGAAFQDTISMTLTQRSKRTVIPSVALLDSINWQQAFALYKDRFADASGFTFMFVGDFNLDTLKTMVAQYLASLPSLGRQEKARDVGIRRPQGVVKKVVYGGTEPRATTMISFHGPYQYSIENSISMQMMNEVLKFRLTKRLREELGGTYGVQTGTSRSINPVAQYTVDINFLSDPARREELTTAVFQVIDSLKKAPPSQSEVQEAIEPALRQLELARKTNGYWLSLLSLREQNREFKELLDDSKLKAVTPAMIQKAAQTYLNTSNYAQFDLLPVPGSTPAAAPAATSAQ